MVKKFVERKKPYKAPQEASGDTNPPSEAVTVRYIE